MDGSVGAWFDINIDFLIDGLLRVCIFSTTRNSTPELIPSFGVEFRLVEKILTLIYAEVVV